VPVVVCGSKITSEMILKERGMVIPWRSQTVVEERKALDVIRRPVWMPSLWMIALVLGLMLGAGGTLCAQRRPAQSLRWEQLREL
jgi:hypothetical protein